MVQISENERKFWSYLSQSQKDLISEGEYLMNDIIRDGASNFKDYSFLIFPFAKAYEGFLKQLFRDVRFISRLDYISDHLRLGKLMSPHLVDRLGDKSLYQKIQVAVSAELADKIWETWRIGRNQIFHYFPHNLKAVSFIEASNIIERILDTMEEAYEKIKNQLDISPN